MTSQKIDVMNLYHEINNLEYYIMNNIDDDLLAEYNQLQELNNKDLSYNEIVNKYAKILYFWSNRMPDFGDIENGEIDTTFKWLFIQNKIIQTLRRIKRLKGALLRSVLDRYVLVSLSS